MRKIILKKSRVFLCVFSALIIGGAVDSFAQEESKNFPNISGQLLLQTEYDHIVSSAENGVPKANGFIYAQPTFSLNLTNNFSVKTQWRFQPNDRLTTRNPNYPERYRTFINSNREVGISDNGLLIEELKVNFENEDLAIFAGKFDPKFGFAHDKTKRIGVFLSQFNEDYNLREKIGVGLVATLDDVKISANSFFNDKTGMSESWPDDRGRANNSKGLAGNQTMSSYSISLAGSRVLGIEDLSYNVAYRSLDVGNIDGASREQGLTAGGEYKWRIGSLTYLIPMIELVKINNFTGFSGRNATYLTASTKLSYDNWSAGISYANRDISNKKFAASNENGRQLQLFVGYKFKNGLTIDIARAKIKEGNNSASLIGGSLGYIYQF